MTTGRWTKLRIKLPFPASFLSAVRLNDSRVLLLGGSRISSDKSSQNGSNHSSAKGQLGNKQVGKVTGKTNHVYLFDLTMPCFDRLDDLT